MSVSLQPPESLFPPSLSKPIKARFVEILLGTAVHHAPWLIMQIFGTHTQDFLSMAVLRRAHSCMHAAAFVVVAARTTVAQLSNCDPGSGDTLLICVHALYVRYIFKSTTG